MHIIQYCVCAFWGRVSYTKQRDIICGWMRRWKKKRSHRHEILLELITRQVKTPHACCSQCCRCYLCYTSRCYCTLILPIFCFRMKYIRSILSPLFCCSYDTTRENSSWNVSRDLPTCLILIRCAGCGLFSHISLFGKYKMENARNQNQAQKIAIFFIKVLWGWEQKKMKRSWVKHLYMNELFEG